MHFASLNSCLSKVEVDWVTDTFSTVQKIYREGGLMQILEPPNLVRNLWGPDTYTASDQMAGNGGKTAADHREKQRMG